MSLPESWVVVRVATPAGEEEAALVVEALLELGGRAVWEEGGWSVTHLPDESDVAGAVGSEAGADAAPESDPDPLAATESRIRARLPGHDLQVALQPHRDWASLWKVGLEARRLTDRIVVTPTWIDPEIREGDLVVTLDPGMAFGNAEHGTTRGCIRILEGVVRPGDRILDVGAGSAILSIVSALLGAGSVHAVEGDELAIETAMENAERNGVADRVTVEHRLVSSDEVAGYGEHDGVVANIESGLLRPLLPGLVAATRPGGWLLLSGILDHEWAALRREVEALRVREVALDADGEWRSGLFRREGAE